MCRRKDEGGRDVDALIVTMSGFVRAMEVTNAGSGLPVKG